MRTASSQQLAFFFGVATAWATGSATAQTGSLQACRSITEPVARLACYDGLPTAAAAPAAPAAAALPAPVRPEPAPRVALPALATATAAAAPVAKPAAADLFGLPVASRADEAQEVRTQVGPNFEGWRPNQRLRLANGQVWQIVDGSSVALPEGPRAVTVKRGALASYYLDFEGLKTSPRVRRVE